MTADFDERSGELPEGPLQTLCRRIESARQLRPVRETVEENASDPLATLRGRIESASELEVRNERAPPAGPLAQLLATIDRARRATAADDFDRPERQEPSTATGDPLQRLHRRIASAIEAVGARSSVDLSPRTGALHSAPNRREGTETGEVEARVGREVLEMLAARELSGDVRAEAVRRLADAVDDPDSEAIRDVLRLLIAPGAADRTDN